MAMGQNLRYLFSRDYHLFKRLFKGLEGFWSKAICDSEKSVFLTGLRGRPLAAGVGLQGGFGGFGICGSGDFLGRTKIGLSQVFFLLWVFLRGILKKTKTGQFGMLLIKSIHCRTHPVLGPTSFSPKSHHSFFKMKQKEFTKRPR